MTRPGSTAVVALMVVAAAGSAQAQDHRAKLTERPWSVVWVASAGPAADIPATLSFDAAGRLSGSGGCNRLLGDYKLAPGGKSLKIQGVAATRRLCAGAVMRFERAVIAALNTADALRYDSEGRLILTQGAADLIVLTPSTS